MGRWAGLLALALALLLGAAAGRRGPEAPDAPMSARGLASAPPEPAPGPPLPHIVGGSPAVQGQFPYQVAVRYFPGDGSAFLCGGSLLDPRHVLTAAHCVTDDKGTILRAKNFMITAGTISYSDSSALTLRGLHVWAHSEFNKNAIIENDIGLIRVDGTFNFSGVIKAIALRTSTPGAGETCKVSGWGASREGGSAVSGLQFAEVPVVNKGSCERAYGTSLHSGQFCAGAWQKDACQGDSGGPLVCGGKLSGIVSFGYGCGREGFPGVYTDVSQYAAWISRTRGRSSAGRAAAALLLPLLPLLLTRGP